MKSEKPSKHDATILFCDIRGFTQLFDERDPLDAVAFANNVLGELGMIIESSNGTIDKFTGDGILAHFGIKGEAKSSQADDACRCALRMLRRLVSLNEVRHFDDQPVVQLGIGINSGTVATGLIQTMQKKEFTVLGDAVNTASRIESLTKYFSVDCLISERTRELVTTKFDFQKMPPRALRGVNRVATTYWLMPTNEDYNEFAS